MPLTDDVLDAADAADDEEDEEEEEEDECDALELSAPSAPPDDDTAVAPVSVGLGIITGFSKRQSLLRGRCNKMEKRMLPLDPIAAQIVRVAAADAYSKEHTRTRFPCSQTSLGAPLERRS